MAGVIWTARSGDRDVDSLLSSFAWNASTLTYSFPRIAQDYGSDYGSGEEPFAGFASLGNDQETAAQEVLANIAAVANLTFREVSGGAGDLRFGATSATGSAHAYLPHFDARSGDTWFSNAGYWRPVKGSYDYFAFLHEIGHAIGLKHAHERDGFGAMSAEHDAMEFTAMTYRSYQGADLAGFANEEFGFAQTLMMYDIAALQHLYGANFTSNAGNSIYRWDGETGEMSINGVGQGVPGANRIFMTLWDGGGNDTYDLSRYRDGVKIDLRPGEWTRTTFEQVAEVGYGEWAPGNIANALLYGGDTRSLIENAIGGAGDDLITGNEGANRLRGGGGVDGLYGLEGDDLLSASAGRVRDRIVLRDGQERSERELAFSLDSAMTLEPDAHIEAATTIPHATVEALTTGADEWYRITVREAGTIIVDLDDSVHQLGLELYDHAGRSLDASRYSGREDPGDSGERAHIAYEVDDPGHYFIRVGYGSEAPNRSYVMHVSAPGAVTGQLTGSLLDGGAGQDSLLGHDGADTLAGGAEADTLDGGKGIDTVRGGDGADVLIGRSDGDTLDGGEGLDVASYAAARRGVSVDLSRTFQQSLAAGADWLTGIEGLTGSPFADRLKGDAGSNVLDGGAGADILAGGGFNDTFIIDQGNDRIVESASDGDDLDHAISSVGYVLPANVELLTLTGTAAINGRGNGEWNVLTGNDAANVLDGYGGTDELDGRGGADTMRGGDGNDTYYVDHAGDRVVETIARAVDHVESSVSYTLGANVEDLSLAGSADLSGTGNSLANNISGNEGDNRLDGGAGADRMYGGEGNDTYVVDRATDRVIDSVARDDVDRVESSVTFRLPEGLEHLILTGTARTAAHGNAAANSLTGNGAANKLDGAAGADRLMGGGGNDVYVIDAAGDVVIEASLEGGTDTVRSAVGYALGIKLENLTLFGGADVHAVGNRLSNILTGNVGSNRLEGGAGADRLLGGAGNDALLGGRDSDVMTGGAGRDAFVFDSLLRSDEVDTIRDFISADDTVRLDHAIFAGFADAGGIGIGAFRAGRHALDGNDRILYDEATGKILYDADGDGAVAAVLFAKVAQGTELSAGDFVVFG